MNAQRKQFDKKPALYWATIVAMFAAFVLVALS
jgi:hypothetical protein